MGTRAFVVGMDDSCDFVWATTEVVVGQVLPIEEVRWDMRMGFIGGVLAWLQDVRGLESKD